MPGPLFPPSFRQPSDTEQDASGNPPLPEEVAGHPTGGRRGWRRVWPVLGAISVGLLGLGVALALRSGDSPTTAPRADRDHPPPRFTLPLRTVASAFVDRGGKRGPAREVGREVAVALSAFYQRAFVDPGASTGRISSDAWEVFAPQAKRRARKDAASLTLGRMAVRFSSLTVVDSGLAVRVLFDGADRPHMAMAEVRFVGSGRTLEGDVASVRNRATFLLQPISGRWLVVGYPSAETRISLSPLAPPPRHGMRR